MEKVELKMNLGKLASLSGEVLEFMESKGLTLAETVTILDSAAGIARAKLLNTVAFAGLAQSVANLLSEIKD